MLKARITVPLSMQLEYGENGTIAYTNEVILIAPNNQSRQHTSFIKSVFTKVMMKQHEKFKQDGVVAEQKPLEKDISEDDQNSDARAIYAMLIAGIEDDMTLAKFEDAFKKLLTSGLCLLKESPTKIALTEHMYTMLDSSDTDLIIGKYLINFAKPS